MYFYKITSEISIFTNILHQNKLPEAESDIPRKHSLLFYYPYLHRFYSKCFLHISDLPSAYLSLANQQGLCHVVMPNHWGCAPAKALPAAEPALPSKHNKDLDTNDFKRQFHPNTDDKVSTLNLFSLQAKKHKSLRFYMKFTKELKLKKTNQANIINFASQWALTSIQQERTWALFANCRSFLPKAVLELISG